MKPQAPVLTQETAEYPTEDAYRRYLETLGKATTAYQRETLEEIFRLARLLDQLLRTRMTKPSQVEYRQQLLVRIRHLTADLRDSLHEEKVRLAVEAT